MSEMTHDVIVVGARCAGAATARLLARKGYRTVMVDRAGFPSDMPMSSHLLWHSGAAHLKRWGLLERLQASGCPPMFEGSLDLGAFTLVGRAPSPDGVAAYAPRRLVLDSILRDAALEAGAELRQHFLMDDVIWENGRVVGVRGGPHGGAQETFRAPVVIGADGRTSKVAKAVGAKAYNEMPAATGVRFSYFSGVPAQMEFIPGLRRMLLAVPTNDALTLVGVTMPVEDFLAGRDNVEQHFFSELEQWAPSLAARVRAGKREDAWLGGAVDSFCRTAAGPGWALVGDAGLTVDPISAAGMTNAFRDAELLANAVDDGLSGRRPLDEALHDYGVQRDAGTMPIYQFTAQMAQLLPPTPEIGQFFGGLKNNQADVDQYFGVFAQTVPVADFFSPDNMARIMAAA